MLNRKGSSKLSRCLLYLQAHQHLEPFRKASPMIPKKIVETFLDLCRLCFKGFEIASCKENLELMSKATGFISLDFLKSLSG